MKKRDYMPTILTLEQASSDTLKAIFEEFLGIQPPARSSVDFLRKNLAWAIQVKSHGKSPADIRKQLLRSIQKAPAAGKRHCRPGTSLVREWHGEIHEVRVLEKGYSWNGRHFRSLSGVAQAITGTRWSGPRFFSLKE